ncbi:MAG: ABC transporter permease [Clostridia bacterium]|nr:ABC transporter permease [Clostridia bacterium]
MKTAIFRSPPTQSRLQKLAGWASPRFIWGMGAVITFLATWETVSTLKIMDPRYISKPSQVVQTGFKMLSNSTFYHHLYISMLELIIGFSLAVLLGLLMGLLMGRSQIIRGLFDPLVMALYATPRVALMPLFVIWFGVGIWSKVFVVFVGAIFPILVNTMTGIRQVEPLLLRAGRSYGASEWQLFTKILLPGSLPAMITGLRLGWGRGIIGVIIGEIYVSSAGLGHLLNRAGNALRTDDMFFLVVVVAGIGYLATSGFSLMERKLTPWKEEKGA